MIATLLDTVTGDIRISAGINTFQWEENNWSCDCNRESFFGVDSNEGRCIGAKRFIVIKAEKELDDDYDCTLAELNIDYPKELLANYGIQ